MCRSRVWDGVGTSWVSGEVEVGGVDSAAAIEAAFRTEYVGLVASARLLLDDRGEAEEAVQEAFVRTFARRRSLRQAAADPSAYLRRAVVNQCRGGLRRRRTRRAAVLPKVEDAVSADVDVIRANDRDEVLAALRDLPARQRECVVMRYLLDASTQETAAALGISSGSVKTHLHRGIAALEERLKDIR
jgi:RNA polymerase sigma-70 factor (sigma-E family)